MSVYLNPSIALNITAIQHKIALSFACHEYQSSFMITLSIPLGFGRFDPDSLLFGYSLMVQLYHVFDVFKFPILGHVLLLHEIDSLFCSYR